DELVDVVDCPLTALALHGGRIVEPGFVAPLAANHTPKMRTDLVRATLLKGMTSLAFFGCGLAALGICRSQQGLDRLIRLRRGDLSAALCLLRHSDIVAGLFQLARRENRTSSDV